METENSIESIRNRHRALAELAAQLQQTIRHEETREVLLGFALNSLSDVDTLLVPQALKAQNARDVGMWLQGAVLMLNVAAKQLAQAQDAVRKYGPDVRAFGG